MRQAVILVGGTGTRLGNLTENCPKPFLDVGGKPFIDYLISKAKTFGIEEVLLLAGYRADWIEDLYQSESSNVVVRIVVEPKSMGTAGALLHAQGDLDDVFLLLNGDSYLDSNWADLVPLMEENTSVVMALRKVDDSSRYGSVKCDGSRVSSFVEKDSSSPIPGTVNAGVYLVNKSKVLALVDGPKSLEIDVLPMLVADGTVKAISQDGYFIDIGLPSSLSQARGEFPEILQKPAVIFDRDNTLVVDSGYTYKVDDLVWLDGAKESICRLNRKGIQVFVATNQSGQARGYYTEKDMQRFHQAMQKDMLKEGGHIDGFYFCPHHPDGVIPELSVVCNCRKPSTGMLSSIVEDHYVDINSSVLVGDKVSDIEAAEAFGILAYQFPGGSLLTYLQQMKIL